MKILKIIESIDDTYMPVMSYCEHILEVLGISNTDLSKLAAIGVALKRVTSTLDATEAKRVTKFMLATDTLSSVISILSSAGIPNPIAYISERMDAVTLDEFNEQILRFADMYTKEVMQIYTNLFGVNKSTLVPADVFTAKERIKYPGSLGAAIANDTGMQKIKMCYATSDYDFSRFVPSSSRPSNTLYPYVIDKASPLYDPKFETNEAYITEESLDLKIPVVIIGG